MEKTWKRIVSWFALALATVVLWIPIYYFVIGAFKKRTDIVKHPLTLDFSRMSFDNFTYAFKKMNLFKALGNTGFITVIALLIVIICGSLAGFAIARIHHKVFRVFYTVVIALMVVPFIGALIPIVVLIHRIGLYGSLWGNVLIQAAWNLPFSIFLFTGFMQSLPKEMEDAAYIDGIIMASLPIVIMFLFLQKYFIKGLVAGVVKG